MKKACILSTVDISRLSLTTIYTDYFKDKSIDCDIVCVKKFDDSKGLPGIKNQYEFDIRKVKKYPFFLKLIYFAKMIKFFDNINKQNHYDFIVVWNELTAFIFANYLKKHFKNNYCINIRDYHFFQNSYVYFRLKKSISNAMFNTTSSAKYLQFLPNKNFYILHSMNFKVLEDIERKQNINYDYNRPINILYIGQISWLENLKLFLNVFGNDERFNIIIAGTGSEKIMPFISENKINNVELYGRFQPNEEKKFLERADVLYNLYGFGNKHLDLALSIKLYYAIYLRMPIITYEGTYTDEMANKCGIAFSTKKSNMSLLPDKIQNYFKNRDLHTINMLCNEIETEAIDYRKKVYGLLNEYFNK